MLKRKDGSTATKRSPGGTQLGEVGVEAPMQLLEDIERPARRYRMHARALPSVVQRDYNHQLRL